MVIKTWVVSKGENLWLNIININIIIIIIIIIVIIIAVNFVYISRLNKVFIFLLKKYYYYYYYYYCYYYYYNRIYNKILDRDWFPARLFVT